jgi:hypothetical protein
MLSILNSRLLGFLTSSQRVPRKIHPTSYLDGLRGVVAFIVVIHHYTYEFTSISPWGWHTGEPGSHDYLLLMPLLRVVHAGRFMVVMFFIISGYVLSCRGLQLAREGKQVQLLESLSSFVSTFRLLSLHLWPSFLPEEAIGSIWRRIGTTLVARASSGGIHMLREHLCRIYMVNCIVMLHFKCWRFTDWYLDTIMLIDPFRYGDFAVSRYNINILWTSKFHPQASRLIWRIPVPQEWMGSMVVFATVLGIARTNTWSKFSILFILIYYCHFNARWEPTTFLTGLLLAELSGHRAKYMKHPFLKDRLRTRASWSLLFLFGIYAGLHPQKGPESAPGYQTLM